jgi:O-antigen ligase
MVETFQNKTNLAALSSLSLFLFPIAGNSIRSWTGTLFFMLAITGLVYLARARRHVSIDTREKVLVALLTLLFFAWISSALANGWNDLQTKGLGIQIRVLLFLPVYFLVKDNPHALKWLTYGCIPASAVLFYECFSEVVAGGRSQAFGVYDSPGLIAMQSLVFIFCLASYLIRAQSETAMPMKMFLVLGILLAAASLVLSGSRATYLTVVLLCLISPFLLMSVRRAAISVAVGMSVLTTIYFTVELANRQVNRGYSEFITYVKNPNKLTEVHGSVGARLEMWRAALKVGLDNPAFGVGWRSFSTAAQKYVAEGKINGSSIGHPHPHNSYLEFLVTAGIPGLITFAAVLLYPLFLALKVSKRAPRKAALLTMFSTMLVINSVTEGGTLIYGNALSFFLIFLAVIFSDFIRQSRLNSPSRANQ